MLARHARPPCSAVMLARHARPPCSPAMLGRLRETADAAALPVCHGDMAQTRVPGDFALVPLVVNTIANLLTQDAQVACFQNAARHLRPGGCLVVELWVPELQKLPGGRAPWSGRPNPTPSGSTPTMSSISRSSRITSPMTGPAPPASPAHLTRPPHPPRRPDAGTPLGRPGRPGRRLSPPPPAAKSRSIA